MKRVKRRANIAFLIAGLIAAGLLIFLTRLAAEGKDWALFRANRSVYSDGVLNVGTLTDRKGVTLAHAGGGIYWYADDYATRVSCFHVVGDYTGNIGTGAVNAFSYKLAGYSFAGGVKDGGETVALTTDADLNAAAYGALNGRKGAVLVSDYKTGDILCMVSSPGYDPQYPPASVESPEYEGVYVNRCISSVFTPGSVFKAVTIAAAVEKIEDLSGRTFYCAGSLDAGGDIVTCTGIHGAQTAAQAFANSCNCAFAQISLELGPLTIREYATAYGLLSPHDLDGIPTAAGSFDMPAAESETAWAGIGQYNDLVSPYSLLRYVCAIANDGILKEPHILKDADVGGRTGSRLVRADTAAALKEMMKNNVESVYGAWNFPGLDVCAKTGTAEVGDGSSHAWITGFLDDGKNPLAFTVIVENGGGGLSAAAPVANAALQAAVGRA